MVAVLPLDGLLEVLKKSLSVARKAWLTTSSITLLFDGREQQNKKKHDNSWCAENETIR